MKADVFFLVSTIATVVIAALAIVLLYYLIKAGKNLYMLSEILKKDFKDSEEFVGELKERLEGNIIFRLFFPPLKRRHRAATKDDTKEKGN